MFLPARSSPAGAIVVQMVEVDGRLRMRVVSVDLDKAFDEVWDIEVPLEDGAKAFCEGSVSLSGFVSILCEFETRGISAYLTFFSSDERDLVLVSTKIRRRHGISEYARYYPAYCAVIYLILNIFRLNRCSSSLTRFLTCSPCRGHSPFLASTRPATMGSILLRPPSLLHLPTSFFFRQQSKSLYNPRRCVIPL